ncbi:hypothetical protein C1H46_041703 [Malus baccata]|uniref:Uncharacterized protein n=1 Tax=Malus baccata TaxID=106549 RepID=A0A540KEX8_MALBA|nr:hypothetical protein C1H46_041703 [Malus baccata]
MSNEVVVVQPPWLMSVVEESGSLSLIHDAKQPSHHECLKLQAERERKYRKKQRSGEWVGAKQR